MTCAKIFGSGRADGSPPQAGCDTARIADEVVRPRAENFCGDPNFRLSQADGGSVTCDSHDLAEGTSGL